MVVTLCTEPCRGAPQNCAGGLSPVSDIIHFCTFPDGNELSLVWD